MMKLYLFIWSISFNNTDLDALNHTRIHKLQQSHADLNQFGYGCMKSERLDLERNGSVPIVMSRYPLSIIASWLPTKAWLLRAPPARLLVGRRPPAAAQAAPSSAEPPQEQRKRRAKAEWPRRRSPERNPMKPNYFPSPTCAPHVAHYGCVWLAAQPGHGSIGPVFKCLVGYTGSGTWLNRASRTPGAWP